MTEQGKHIVAFEIVAYEREDGTISIVHTPYQGAEPIILATTMKESDSLIIDSAAFVNISERFMARAKDFSSIGEKYDKIYT